MRNSADHARPSCCRSRPLAACDGATQLTDGSPAARRADAAAEQRATRPSRAADAIAVGAVG